MVSASARNRVASSRLVWVALAVLAAIGLALGSGLGSGASQPSRAERIAHLEAIIGCPSCTDLSVAESSAATAVAIRDYVVAQVHAGASDRAIEAAVEAGYGASIVLSPAKSGVDALVWILPLIAVLGGIVGLTVLFRRRHRTPADAPSEADRQLVEDALSR